MVKRLPLLLISLTVALATNVCAQAASTADRPRLHLAYRDAGAGLSLNQAVQQVQQQTGGRVLSADPVQQGGRTYYRIKVLTPNGQVRIITVDAHSGSGR